MRRNLAIGCLVATFVVLLSGPAAFAQRRRLPRPRRLDQGLELRRDAATGELRRLYKQPASARLSNLPLATFRARVSLVEINCAVVQPNGTALRGLARDDFRLFEDGVEQHIAYLDASSAPASIAVLVDSSPSVFREWRKMKAAARSLAGSLGPRDELAVVAFAGEVRLLLPFSRDRALLEQAIGAAQLARDAGEPKGSNVYLAVYLTAHELFRGRMGRKAIALLTDGQDSGLGLSWDPASAAPKPEEDANRLTFEDVARELAAAGVELYAISTQSRPQAMTDAWLDAHRTETLITPAAREVGVPHYTVYLAELVRRVGGRLYFLREIGTLSDVYQRIAEALSAQYTLGYYPTAGFGKPGWRKLRVELAHRDSPEASRDARLSYRHAYYLPAEH